jgi:hypothetical protein
MSERSKYVAEAAKSAIGIFLKHTNNTDVCFFASGVMHHDDIILSLRGFWINIASQSKYTIDSDVISIKVSDIDNWEEIPDPRDA